MTINMHKIKEMGWIRKKKKKKRWVEYVKKQLVEDTEDSQDVNVLFVHVLVGKTRAEHGSVV